MSSPQVPKTFRLDAIAGSVGGEVVGSPDVAVSGVAGLEEAERGQLSYVSADRYIKAAHASKAGAFVVHKSVPELGRPHIVVANPAYAFALIVERFFVTPPVRRGISSHLERGEQVVIGQDPSVWPFVTLGHRVSLGDRVTLYPGVFVGDDAVIGDDTVLYPNVTVREGCRIGSRVIVHSGSVIGSDGFGYVPHEGRHQKIPQIGIVVVEDDVEVGANVTIDRATFGQTVIKRGVKVDNLVQIAHNVTVGEHSILVAQVGIAGSTTLGHHVVVGGQAGLADHLEIGERAMIAGKSGVGKNVAPGQVVSGTPALPHETTLRVWQVTAHLPELRKQVRDLERRLQALEEASEQPRQSQHSDD